MVTEDVISYDEVISNMNGVYIKRENLDTKKDKHHVVMKAQTEVMHLQAKEC